MPPEFLDLQHPHPQASPESLQMPERDARDGRRSPFGAAAAARATHSAVLGPQTHRLPSKVMWSCSDEEEKTHVEGDVVEIV